MADNGIRWTKRSRGVLQFKPCPFCGGEASITSSESGHGFFVGCLNDGCPINPSSGDFLLDGVYDEEMKQAAVNEWNTRAERTCHVVKNSRKYVLSDGTELFDDGCSICNGYIGAGENYCSNCGAKVVE